MTGGDLKDVHILCEMGSLLDTGESSKTDTVEI